MPAALDSYPEHSRTISDSEGFRNSKNDARGEEEDQEEGRTLSLKFSWWQPALHGEYETSETRGLGVSRCFRNSTKLVLWGKGNSSMFGGFSSRIVLALILE